ncbi:MAG: hypothetical protein ACYCX3_01105 [Thermoleophilia bacterium]
MNAPETREPRRLGGLRGRLLVLAAAVVVLGATAYWALAVYDAGPRFEAASVAEVQVAAGGWVPVDLEGPTRAELTAFFTSLDNARALWPPRLLFE